MNSNSLKTFVQTMTARFNHRFPVIVAIAGAVSASVLCGCGTANISGRRDLGVSPVGKPQVIYVSDFELDPGEIKSEKGFLPALPKLTGPLAHLPPLPGTPKDPKKVARKLIDEMSEALVERLTKAGLNARRLGANGSMPASGWLVRGVFTEVNQGNQLRRAVIGFGLGKTDLHVFVDVTDLSRGQPGKFYELNATANSGKTPGAGPTLVLGPAGLAARFVITSRDLDRNVKQTAAKIAAEVAQRTRQSAGQMTALYEPPPEGPGEVEQSAVHGPVGTSSELVKALH